MPVKTHNHKTKKYPKHYTKVYWPYLPLVLVMFTALAVGHSFVGRSQRGVLAYSTNVTSIGLLQATNNARTSNHDHTLGNNTFLAAAAQNKANDMVKKNYWSHLTPSGQTPWSFIDATGYQYQKAGENLAYGFDISSNVINGWMNSPAHRANMLDSGFQTVGFGIAQSENYQHTGPETVVVALYAQPLGATTTTKTTGYTTLTTQDQPPAQQITKAQALTSGKAPWIGFALGLLIGAGLVYLFLTHSLRWHHSRKKKQPFRIKHPIQDVTILVGIILCLLLIQSVGVIR